jgi:hypothetical protein
MRLQYDFTANVGTHFGIIRPVNEILAEIPNMFDAWNADSDTVTLAGGRVATWTGVNGRVLSQPTNERRPYLDGQGIRMWDGITAQPLATMGLDGGGVGTGGQFTVAIKVSMPTAALDIANQFLWASDTPLLRCMRQNVPRYRMQINTTADIMEIEAVANQTNFGLVLTVNGTTLTLRSSDGSVTHVSDNQAGIGGLFIGGTSITQPSLVGWVKRIGVWKHNPNASQLTTIMNWVS